MAEPKVPKWLRKLEDEALAAGEPRPVSEPARCGKTGSTAPCPADQSGCPEC